MSLNLRDLVRWTEKPARNVEAGTGSPTNLLRGLAARCDDTAASGRLSDAAQSAVVGP